MNTFVTVTKKAIVAGVVLCIAFSLTCTALRKKGKAPSIPKEKFHLYLLIGQSNMAGRGKLSEQDKQAHPRVFTLKKDNQWVPAVDPIHFDKPIAGVGPGLTFGKVMAENNPDISIGLIPCAAGGSSISVWKAGAWFEQTESHPYDNAIKRAEIAMKNGTLKGILWHQGEGDGNEEAAQLYEERLVKLIYTLRQDLDSPDLPFVAGRLGKFYIEKNSHARTVDAVLARLPRLVTQTACVDSKGLMPKEDGVHFNAESARELGRRYAEAMLRLEK